ncbi:MAG: hypothetical protein AAF438_15825 [Pseudomonadota bacterium]
MRDKDLGNFGSDFTPAKGDIPIDWARVETGLSPVEFAAVVDELVKKGAIQLFFDRSGCKWGRPTRSGLALFAPSAG